MHYGLQADMTGSVASSIPDRSNHDVIVFVYDDVRIPNFTPFEILSSRESPPKCKMVLLLFGINQSKFSESLSSNLVVTSDPRFIFRYLSQLIEKNISPSLHVINMKAKSPSTDVVDAVTLTLSSKLSVWLSVNHWPASANLALSNKHIIGNMDIAVFPRTNREIKSISA